jgi:hypothetical protein
MSPSPSRATGTTAASSERLGTRSLVGSATTGEGGRVDVEGGTLVVGAVVVVGVAVVGVGAPTRSARSGERGHHAQAAATATRRRVQATRTRRERRGDIRADAERRTVVVDRPPLRGVG